MGIGRFFAALMVSFVLIVGMADARPLNLNEITEGVCRVTAQQAGGYGNRIMSAKGSGTVVEETQSTYKILTNAHVVGNAKTVQVEFFRGGRRIGPVAANVVWSRKVDGRDVDFAVCEVAKSSLGQYAPRVIPLAPADYQPKPGYYISAVGCDDGRWARGWEGYIQNDTGSRVVFTPPPVGGQSGSGVMVLVPNPNTGELYTRVGAVLTWRTGHATDDSRANGAAIPISRFYQAQAGQVSHEELFEVPVSWIECSEHTMKGIGSDGVRYATYISIEGDVKCEHPSNVQIVGWTECACPKCGRNHAPYNTPSAGGVVPNGPYNGQLNPFNGWQPFGIGGGGQAPAPNPGTPAPTPNIGGSGNIIAPPAWPGADEQKPDVVIDDKVQDKAEEYEEILKRKAEIEEELLAAEAAARAKRDADEAAAKAKAEAEAKDKEVGFFSTVTGRITGFGGGVLLGIGIWMLRIIWVRFLRKRVIQGVDTVQDRIQALVTKRFGKAAGKKARDMMEGVEDSLLAVVENVLESEQVQEANKMAGLKGKIADRVTNGETDVLRASKPQLIEAIRVATADAADTATPTTTEEIPEKVKEILKAARATDPEKR
jgi:hypothetical protein